MTKKEEIGQRMAELVQTQIQLEQQKSNTSKSLNEQIRSIGEEIDKLSALLLKEPSEQTDMFDGIEEAEHTEIITDESKLLNSGLELPENVDPEEVKKIEQDFALERELNETFGFDQTTLCTETNAFIIVEDSKDLELMNIVDYDSEQLENWKGKLLIHFETELQLQSFIRNYLLSQKKSYERFGKYILISPVTVEADND